LCGFKRSRVAPPAKTGLVVTDNKKSNINHYCKNKGKEALGKEILREIIGIGFLPLEAIIIKCMMSKFQLL